ncbi:peptidoglycan DD-metalloendopeptidase family protein [Pseudomonas alcaligenes]|uniref:Peptidoglycan DD-metalloendopeptidase family protein n=1 Tax=Aquipseudomonas alcaligenes TaxID=43263 RepID=A0AB73HVR5_AQUAC|nr:peptidoglycan DD-metalloendopeptidase family protein [Pseudomonas alcaligenes]MDH0142011.1 peptidoglycan DD-metalloendopeptidase family protein [Pseudomonas alcaligenes]MEE1950022.1 peptidoglycan DD-metalloendopeptidase family protein [Pseudomonas alcaligenes]
MKGLGLGAAVFAAILSGCSSSPSTPPQVVDRTHGGGTAAPARPQATAGAYRVQRGDTLYSIAFRFGWDWKALAARNSIPAPYTIRPGQLIRFDVPSAGGAPVVVQQSKPPATKPPTSRPPVQSQPPAKAPTPPTAQPQPPVVVAGGSATAGKVQPVQRSAQGWAWPANGMLIGKFSSNGSLNKGIDIAGELGQPVLAAADGAVVYAGSGLRGYGELVIIKHSDAYVSAYGHNRRLLVREGQQVKVGQHIAEMGSTGADRVKLHFEIRRQGKPVDPLQYLPRR